MNFPKKNNSIKKVGRILTTIVGLTASQLFTNCKSSDTNISPIATVEKITICRNGQSIQINKTDKLSTDLDTCPTAINIPSDYKIPVKMYGFNDALATQINKYGNMAMRQMIGSEYKNEYEISSKNNINMIDYMPKQKIYIDRTDLKSFIEGDKSKLAQYPELIPFRDFIISQINNNTNDQTIFVSIAGDQVRNPTVNGYVLDPRIQITSGGANAVGLSLTGTYGTNISIGGSIIKKNIILIQSNGSLWTFGHEIGHTIVNQHSGYLDVKFNDNTNTQIRPMLSVSRSNNDFPIIGYYLVGNSPTQSIYGNIKDFKDAVASFNFDKIYKFLDPSNGPEVGKISLSPSGESIDKYKKVVENNYIGSKLGTNNRISADTEKAVIKFDGEAIFE